MKNLAIIKKAFAVVLVIALTSATAYAHSSHDHSKLPLKWHFSDATKAKVIAKMASGSWDGLLGLSKLEQKIFNTYGINIGNTFNSILEGKYLAITRISSGVKVMEVEGLSGLNRVLEIPFRHSNAISKVSTNPVHLGHDHKILDKEWTFSSKTKTKIAQRIQNRSYPISVGLTSIEKEAMEEYGIRNGNIFRTHVAGQDLLLTRSSSGIIIDKASKLEVASLNKSGAM